jgi:hypothetical protein
MGCGGRPTKWLGMVAVHRRLRCSRKRMSRAPEGVSPWSTHACECRPVVGACVRACDRVVASACVGEGATYALESVCSPAAAAASAAAASAATAAASAAAVGRPASRRLSHAVPAVIACATETRCGPIAHMG